MKRIHSISLSIVFGFFVISLALVAIWFIPGYMYASGESGLPFWNINRQLFLSKFAWVDLSLGYNNANGTASYPFYYIFSKIIPVIGPVSAQSLFFFITLFTALTGIYLLIREYFPKLDKKSYIMASLFYLFNPITLVNVWNRFLYNHMLFWAFLPLGLFIITRGINKRRYIYAIIFSLTTALFSFVLTSVAFTLILWSVVVLVDIFFFLTKSTKRKFLTLYFILSLVSFTLINLWWLSQYLSFLFSSNFTTAVSGFFTSEGNAAILVTLSELLGKINNVIRFIHGTFFISGPAWANLYDSKIVNLFGFSLPVIIFFIIFRYRRNHHILFFAALLTASLFLIKGIGTPLGEPFGFIFNHFTFIQVFRNPFEKFGFLLPLAASALLAYGLTHLKKIVVVVICLYLILWGIPYFKVWVFSGGTTVENINSTYQISIPDYYRETNLWLNSHNTNSRFVVLPLGGEGITYNWQHPYNGVELSGTFFDRANIALNTTIPFYNQLVTKISNYQISDKVLDFLPFVNADYLILRSDINYKERRMPDPQTTRTLLQNLVTAKLLTNDFTAGDLTVYKTTSQYAWPKIYTTANLVLTNSPDFTQIVNYFPGFPDTKIASVYLNQVNTDKLTDVMTIISPETEFSYKVFSDYQHLTVDDIIARLFYVKHMPTERFYFLVRLKESLMTPNHSDFNSWILYEMGLTGKRAVELYHLIGSNAPQGYVTKAETDYNNSLSQLKTYLTNFVHSDGPVAKVVRESLLYQWQLLKNVQSTSNDFLSDYLMNLKLIPIYPLVSPSSQDYTIYGFEIPDCGSYELSGTDFNSDTPLYLDGNLMTLNTKYLSIDLSQGTHEIALDSSGFTNNLINIASMTLDNSDKIWKVELPDTPKTFKLSFDYRFSQGNTFRLQFLQDIDNLQSPVYNGQIIKDPLYHDWKHYETEFTTSAGAKEGNLNFEQYSQQVCTKKLLLWHNCTTVKDQFNVSIKNFTLDEIDKPQIHLVSKVLPENQSVTGVSFTKIDPTNYKLHIEKENTDPEMLVFSELYSSEWQASIDGKKLDKTDHYLVNSYANGWLINNKGSYDMDITFFPQQILTIAKYISLISFLIFVLLITLVLLKNNENL